MSWVRDPDIGWFYVVGKQQMGPVKLAGLAELYTKGKSGGGIGDDDLSAGGPGGLDGGARGSGQDGVRGDSGFVAEAWALFVEGEDTTTAYTWCGAFGSGVRTIGL